MTRVSCASGSCASASMTQAAQAPSAVSMARMRTRSPERRRQGLAARAAQVKRGSASDRLDLAHVGQEVAQEVLDAVLEGRGRGRAARAGALHVEIDDPVLEAAEGDVAAVARDRRADAGLEQLLDRLDRRRIGGVEELIAVGNARRAGVIDQDWGTGHEMFHDGAE